MSGPWPKVQVSGRLESAEQEWLHTNGAGAYCMSTVAMRHTRRYHGMLVAALSPPVDRWVIVSHLDTDVVVGGRTYRLTVQQSPDAAPTPGYRFLESYDQDPIPRWTYRLGKARFEITLALVRGQNALVVAYEWHGREPAELRIRPLLPMRRIHALTAEHGAMVQRVRLRRGEVDIRPMKNLPRVVFGHRGMFIGSPDWYRKLEYPEDKLRKAACEEDLWTPGGFEKILRPGVPATLVVAVGQLPVGAPLALLDEARRFVAAQDPGDEHPLVVRELSVAAEQFICDDAEAPAVIAGYPWLAALSRDALISLPGLYLVRGRVEGARRVLRTIVRSMRDELVPRRIRDVEGSPSPLSAEATLWLFEAARQLVLFSGAGDLFVKDELYPALLRIFRRVSSEGREPLCLTADGLVSSGDDEVALPWLDARTGAELSRPRRGLTVELQALWALGTETLASLARGAGDAESAELALQANQRTRTAFKERFWCEATRYPYDCLRATDGGEWIADSAIRPNALVALDVYPELFERWQAAAILDRVRDRLLTARGVRSLDPDEPGYRGAFDGTLEERRVAYYQGVAWTHLLGAYARASLRHSPDDFEVEESLRVQLEAACAGGPVLGQVPQFSDGEAPFRPGGCPAQASAVAELLRTLVRDLRL